MELTYTLKNLTDQYVGSQVPVEKILKTISQCAQMIIGYVEDGILPPVEMPDPEYTVLDELGPFVAFESEDYVWDLLYQEGYTCGIWFREEEVRVGRKSGLVPYLDPERVLGRLNEVDPEGDWSISSGAVVGSDTALGSAEIIETLKGVL
jgi:hypothetical protein